MKLAINQVTAPDPLVKTFADIEVGDVFSYSGEFYLKLNDSSASRAVKLTTGVTGSFSDGDPIRDTNSAVLEVKD